MGWDCFFSGALPDEKLQLKVIKFLQGYLTEPSLFVRPEPNVKYSTRMFSIEKGRPEVCCRDYPFNFYGLVDYVDSDGSCVGIQFVFDRSAQGRLIEFNKLPWPYLHRQVKRRKLPETNPRHEDASDGFEVSISSGSGNARSQHFFPFVLSIIKLRWWPDLYCCDDTDSCQDYLSNFWKYGLANKLLDETLDLDTCYAIYKKEHEKYFPPSPPKLDVEETKSKPNLVIVRSESLNLRIVDAEFSVRTTNCLEKMNIETVGELTRYSEEDLLQSKNLGKKSIREIIEVLSDFGYSLEPD